MATDHKSSKKSSYMAPLAILAAGLIIAGAIVYSNRNKPNQHKEGGSQLSPTPTSIPINVKNVDIKNEPFIGDPKAPLTLVEWSDFQCPYCKRFHEKTLPVLVDKYVKTGKLKIVLKDYPFLGPDSQAAAVASNAVWSLYPKEYSRWTKAMFEAQDDEGAGFGDKASIIKLIKNKLPKINANKISQLMDKKQSEYQKEAQADQAEGLSFGIKGTPAFIIGTQIISGAQPANVFSRAIEAELSKIKQ